MGSRTRAEEVASLCARIIRERQFGDDSRLASCRYMRMLMEGSYPCPMQDALGSEIERILKAFEDSVLDDADLVDWVSSWEAQVAQREGTRA